MLVADARDGERDVFIGMFAWPALAFGIVFAVAGIPLTAVGARKAPRSAMGPKTWMLPEVSAGAGSAALRWTF